MAEINYKELSRLLGVEITPENVHGTIGTDVPLWRQGGAESTDMFGGYYHAPNADNVTPTLDGMGQPDYTPYDLQGTPYEQYYKLGGLVFDNSGQQIQRLFEPEQTGKYFEQGDLYDPSKVQYDPNLGVYTAGTNVKDRTTSLFDKTMEMVTLATIAAIGGGAAGLYGAPATSAAPAVPGGATAYPLTSTGLAPGAAAPTGTALAAEGGATAAGGTTLGTGLTMGAPGATGLTVPTALGTGGQTGLTLGGTVAAGGVTGGTAAATGTGLSGLLSGLTGGGAGTFSWGSPLNLMQLASGGVGIYSALKQQDMAEQAAQQQQQYRGGSADALQQQLDPSQLLKMPTAENLTSLPGYASGLEAVQRSLAAQGYQGSGNMMAGLQKYGGDFYQQALKNYMDQQSHLMQMAGVNTTGTSTPQNMNINATNTLASGLGNIMQGMYLANAGNQTQQPTSSQYSLLGN